MIRILTRTAAAVAAAVLFPVIAFAAYNDVTLTTDTVLSINGVSLTITGSSATLESIVVTGTTATLNMQAGSKLKVSSSGKQIDVTTNPALAVTTVCSSGSSSVTLPSAPDTVTAVIIPTNTACTDPSAGSSSGGGGGGTVVGLITSGGGPGSTAPTLPQTAVTAVNKNPAAVAAHLKVLTLALKRGKSGMQIKILQQMLNLDQDTRVSVAGAGSPGKETTLFGPATEVAVKKFQKKWGIVSSGSPATTGYGAVGAKTRAKLNSLFAQ